MFDWIYGAVNRMKRRFTTDSRRYMMEFIIQMGTVHRHLRIAFDFGLMTSDICIKMYRIPIENDKSQNRARTFESPQNIGENCTRSKRTSRACIN